jgi:hypothetical protein
MKRSSCSRCGGTGHNMSDPPPSDPAPQADHHALRAATSWEAENPQEDPDLVSSQEVVAGIVRRCKEQDREVRCVELKYAFTQGLK